MGGELHADPNAITGYAMQLMKVGMSADTLQPLMYLAQMNALASNAFSGFSSGGQFAEGPMMIAAVQENSAVFEQFMADLSTGIIAIAYAAQVCADTYRTTDADNAAAIDMINFAFGDPGAARPAGLDRKLVPGTTMLEDSAKNASGSAQTPDVVANPDSGQTVVSFPGYTLIMYQDGSSRTITATYPQAGVVRVETVLTGKDGTSLGHTTDTTEQLPGYAGGGTVRTIETVSGKATYGTVITTTPDGTQVIQATKNGKPTGDPQIVEPGSQPSSGEQGPVQQALETYSGWHFDGITDYGDAKPTWNWPFGIDPPDSYGPPAAKPATH